MFSGGGVGSRVVARRRTQDGATLIEALLVVMLASAVVLVIAYGLQVSVETDGRTNRQQRMNLALSTLTDGLRQVDFVPPCDGTVSHPCPNDVQGIGGRSAHAVAYQTVLQNQLVDTDPDVQEALEGVSWQVDSVEYWQPVDYSGTDPAGGGYDAAFVADAAAERLTLTVSLRGETLTGSAVKRKAVGQ